MQASIPSITAFFSHQLNRLRFSTRRHSVMPGLFVIAGHEANLRHVTINSWPLNFPPERTAPISANPGGDGTPTVVGGSAKPWAEAIPGLITMVSKPSNNNQKPLEQKPLPSS